MKNTNEFKRNPIGTNELLFGAGKKFFISYNEDPCADFSALRADNGSDETALVDPSDSNHTYRILNGDYRENYLKLVPKGLEACIEFYDKHKGKNNSSWSTGNRMA